MNLTTMCKELKNWFEKEKIFGTFAIANNEIDLASSNIQSGQFFRIVGSVFNDGVYQYPASELTDETFTGAVWLMAVPKELISIIDDINAWEAEYGAAINSPFQSESFGGYSYTKASGNSSDGSGGITWKDRFGSLLDQWRKI